MNTRSGIQVLDSLASIPASDWDTLAGNHPLLSHAFLHALHESGCASAETGWAPCYLTQWREDKLAGAMPLYLKSHSYGEYVFDWSWADAYRRHGRHYYPKLVCAVPFTPATGPRLIAADAYAIAIQAGAILAVLGIYRRRIATVLLAVAGRVGTTRLIDNMPIAVGPGGGALEVFSDVPSAAPTR